MTDVAARESARKPNGQFGVQDNTDPEVTLAPTVPSGFGPNFPYVYSIPHTAEEIAREEEEWRENQKRYAAEEAFAKSPLGKLKAFLMRLV